MSDVSNNTNIQYDKYNIEFILKNLKLIVQEQFII